MSYHDYDCAFNIFLSESRQHFAIVIAGDSTLFLLDIWGNQGHMGQDSIGVKSMGLGTLKVLKANNYHTFIHHCAYILKAYDPCSPGVYNQVSKC